MKLKAFELDSEEFWDYFFSLSKDEKDLIISELNEYSKNIGSNIYVEKELLENK